MPEFDIALLGGRIIDGAGNPWYRAGIGVKDGKIARIGRVNPSEAHRSIDVNGMVVCPGFIDLHTHSDVTLLIDGDAHSKVRQGVTLDVIGESASVSPITGHAAKEYIEEQKQRFGVDVDWTDFTGYFARLTRQGTSINVASSVAPQQIRRAVVGFESREPTPEEVDRMKGLAGQAMRQ